MNRVGLKRNLNKKKHQHSRGEEGRQYEKPSISVIN
jgi:hypothetical protein